MRSRRLLLLLFGLAAQVLRCTPAPKVQRESTNDCTNQEAHNQFDLGPVDTCEVPPTSFCENVDYAVPTSIANLTSSLEKAIEADYIVNIEQGNYECADALREINCAMRFPRCSEDRQTVTLGADLVENCTAKKYACVTAGNEDLLSSICSLNGTYPLSDNKSVDSCKPVTNFSNYSFEHCPVNSQWSVTQWMYELLVYTDRQLATKYAGLGTRYEMCWPNFIKYMCQSVGRCWSSQLSRVESINSLTSCEDTFNCYPDWLAEWFRERHDCSKLPRKDSITMVDPCTPPTTTPTTEATTASTSTPVATTKTPQPTWPTTSQPNFPTISNARILLSSSFVVLVLLFLVLVMVA